MKIEEFLKDVDPEKCNSINYFDYKTGEPVCPLGHGAVKNGYEFKKAIGVRAFMVSLNMPYEVPEIFAKTFDKAMREGSSKRESFDTALKAAKEMEETLCSYEMP